MNATGNGVRKMAKSLLINISRHLSPSVKDINIILITDREHNDEQVI
jgi:hypothetical protein